MSEQGVIRAAACILLGASVASSLALAVEPPAAAPPPAPVENLRAALERAASPSALCAMARAAGDWILRMQDDTDEHRGRFLYEVDPRDGEWPDDFENDNFLRQAGTTYALLLLYEATEDARYLAGAERGVAWALTRLVRDPALPGQAFFEERGHVKLGGSALPLLSLIKLRQLRKTTAHDEVIAEVVRFLLAMQQDDGEFRSIYRYAGSPEHPKVLWDSAIYPGEAMLALTRWYAVTGDARLLAAIDRAMAFYHGQPKRFFQMAFIPWTTTAMVELHELTGERRFATWAVQMTDFMVRTQFADAKLASFGAFRPRASANTGAYLEGVLDAYRLARGMEDAARRERYRFSALAGLRFLAGLQFDAAAAAAYPEQADRLIGAFRAAPDDPTLRIDNTQHALSAVVKSLLLLGGPSR